MGQKVNPIIFRLNSSTEKLRFLGNNTEESSFYLYQNIEVKKYLSRIFESNGIIMHNCIIKRSALKLHIFINFYVTSKILIKSLPVFSNVTKSKTFFKKKSLNSLSILDLKNNFKTTSFLTDDAILLPDFYQNEVDYSFMKKKLIESLLKFTGVSKISLNLNNLQNETILKLTDNKDLKLKVQELSIYSKERFFNEAVEILTLVFYNKDTSQLLAKFIALQFQIMKRHNSFLTFLKRSIFIFKTLKFTNTQGIKIVINGRFNGVPRAKGRIIQIGRLPLQNINSKIDYHYTEAQTPYGTFGIKVWVCEK
jgi:ribosomal protein S3